MSLLEFYNNLPTIDQVPSFYVPGYTEALKTYLGVRVVPDKSFLEGLSDKDLSYLTSVGYPFYFIPLMLGNNCYGYVLKGREKKTPRRHTRDIFPGQAQVKQGQPVCLVEGIKDSYLLRALGLNCIPMLTSEPTSRLLQFLTENRNPIIFIPDNDSYRNQFIDNFRRKISQYKLPYFIYNLSSVKDLGDYFLSEYSSPALIESKSIYRVYKGLSHGSV